MFCNIWVFKDRCCASTHNIMQPRKNIYTTYPFFLTKIQMPVKKISTELFIWMTMNWKKYTLSDDYITTGVKLFWNLTSLLLKNGNTTINRYKPFLYEEKVFIVKYDKRRSSSFYFPYWVVFKWKWLWTRQYNCFQY